MRQSRIQTIQENCMRDINKTTLRVVHRKVGESVTLRLRLFLLKHKQISIKRTRFLHGPFAIVHLPWCFIKLYECSSFTHGFINCLFKVKKSDGRIEGQICSGNYVKLEVHIERPQKQWQWEGSLKLHCHSELFQENFTICNIIMIWTLEKVIWFNHFKLCLFLFVFSLVQ